MKQIRLFEYITLSLMLIVPVPGRLAYGLVLFFMFNLFTLFSLLYRRLIKICGLENFQSLLFGLFLVCLTVVFKQLLFIYSPITAFNLGYIVFMPAICSFVSGNLNEKTEGSLKYELKANLLDSLKFSGYFIFIFLIRDVFGFGTISFPWTTGLVEIMIIPHNYLKSTGVLFGSIPGALIFCVLVVIAINSISERIHTASELKIMTKEEK